MKKRITEYLTYIDDLLNQKGLQPLRTSGVQD